jgi:NhaA family Na+:H+ antiporter
MSRTTRLLRSAQFPAILLLTAAGLGLLLANLPSHDAIAGVLGAHLAVPGLDLSVSHWISDGVLAVFFFVVALELQYELTRGDLRSARAAIQPAIAAAGGVLVPIALYLLVVGPSTGSGSVSAGWPVPTATDIAFALGVLAVFGRGLPSAVRAFLLALAILDDIVGIVFIAVLFAHGLNLVLLVLGVVAVTVFAVLSRLLGGRRSGVVAVAMVIVGLLAWGLFAASGVHATIAGVLLGLAMAPRVADPTRHALEPWVNGLVLPLFAFVAAFVVIPRVAIQGLSPAFFGILLALPAGKLVGISVFGALAQRIRPRGTAPAIRFADLLAVGALGGIGFTVSLLLANLAFAADPAVREQGILAVLLGSVLAMLLAAVLVSWRARAHRAAGDAEDEDVSGDDPFGDDGPFGDEESHDER